MSNKIVEYIKQSRAELKKVVWPTKKQTRNHTLMVIGVSLGLAIFLGAVDFGLNKLLELFVYKV
ncbi:MAG: preprotein translocase subunit SecE [Patescibacteria group bacterium]|jgi:preprotein translocase subunit SecE